MDDMNIMEDIMSMNNMRSSSNEKEAMKKVMEAMFAVNDITLYLDTHPQDRNALNLHKQYVKDFEKAKKYYEDNFGPLSMYAEMNTWSWVYDKWPWEGGRR